MRRTKLDLALPKIANSVQAMGKKILRKKELYDWINLNKSDWNLAKHNTYDEVIAKLIEHGTLELIVFPFPYRTETRYVVGEVNVLETLQTVHKNSYYSHLTALYIHGLIDEENLDTIYLNYEQSPRPPSTGLSQQGIDNAFRRPARTSNNIIELDGLSICAINGKYTNQMAVISSDVMFKGLTANVRVTSLERTLIDIVVRPAYSGGIDTIKNAYMRSKGKASIPLITEYLAKFNHAYPYHQSIGFLLELCGYPIEDIELFKTFPRPYQFYLDNCMVNPILNSTWNLFVPQDLQASKI